MQTKSQAVSTMEELNDAVAKNLLPVISQGHWDLSGDFRVRIKGDATLMANGPMTIFASEESRVNGLSAVGRMSIFVGDRVKAKALGNVDVYASDEAHVEAVRGDVTVRADGNVKVVASSGLIDLYGEAEGTLYTSAEGIARRRAKLIAYNETRATCHDDTTCELYDRAQGHLRDRAKASANDESIVSVHSEDAQVEANQMSAVILYRDAQVQTNHGAQVIRRVVDNVLTWSHMHKAKIEGNNLILYKWVPENGVTQNDVCYREGELVVAPDWDPNPDRECGGGFHASASLEDARRFILGYARKDYLFAAQLVVDMSDIRLPKPDDVYSTKLRFKQAFVRRVWRPE